MFALQQQVEIKEEGERNLREMIKVEQDEAYQQSLAIDRYVLTVKLYCYWYSILKIYKSRFKYELLFSFQF